MKGDMWQMQGGILASRCSCSVPLVPSPTSPHPLSMGAEEGGGSRSWKKIKGRGKMPQTVWGPRLLGVERRGLV